VPVRSARRSATIHDKPVISNNLTTKITTTIMLQIPLINFRTINQNKTMKKLLLSLLLAFTFNNASADNNNNHVAPPMSLSNTISGLGSSVTNAINPTGLSDISNGSGGFLSNGFNNVSTTTTLSTTLNTAGVVSNEFNGMTTGVSFGYNTTGKDIVSSLDLNVSGAVTGAGIFSNTMTGVGAAAITGGTGYTLAFATGSVTSSLTSGSALQQIGNISVTSMAGASGFGSVSATSSATTNLTQSVR
jgi:hypothetical protein